MVTMKDVAKQANVSLMTVSRVINTPEKVKDVTRQKVLKVMKSLQFKPNAAAKALAHNQTRTIHIFIHSVLSTQDPFLMALLAGISDVLSAAYYSFLIRREWDFPYLSDGVIALTSNEKVIKKLRETIQEPLIIFGKTNEPVDWIDFDNHKGIYLMTQFMLDKGHRNIGFLGINTDEGFASERLDGYMDALKEAGISIEPKFIGLVKNHTERSGYDMALELLEYNEITAIVCSSDVLALGVLTAAKSLGIEVPKDLSVSGFDAVFLDQMAEPPLTTIEQPIHAIGKELALGMLSRIEHPGDPLINKTIPPKLIVRNTVGQKK